MTTDVLIDLVRALAWPTALVLVAWVVTHRR